MPPSLLAYPVVVLRTLTSRRWLTWLVVATIWALACLYLGRWQWHRWQSKSLTQHRISANYDAAPVPLTSVMTSTRALQPADEWKQVRVTGRYIGPTELVRNRPNDGGDFGYEVVNVFEEGTTRVLVDRGWIPNGANAGTPSSVPAAPSGTVTVIGWARPTEKSLNRAPIPGELSSISVHDVDHRYRDRLVQGYLRMRSEKTSQGGSPSRPQALGKPSQGMAAGINLSYALQWWAGGITGYVFVLMRARREHLDELADATSTGDTPAREPRRKKTRIWDEEDD